MAFGRKLGLFAMVAGVCFFGLVQQGAWAQRAASPQGAPAASPQAAPASTTPQAAHRLPHLTPQPEGMGR